MNVLGDKADHAEQVLHETHQDRETRRKGAFHEFEQHLPHLPSRFDAPARDNITGHLGAHNPFSHPVSAADAVWLLDNIAYRAPKAKSGKEGQQHEDGGPNERPAWQAEFVAAYFVKNSGRDVGKVVADIADKIGLAGDDSADHDATLKLISSRLEPFLDTILPARTVEAQIGDERGLVKLGPSDQNGISSNTITFQKRDYTDGETISTTAVIEGAEDPSSSNTTHFADPEGWAFISDIDDSIKITMTSSPIGILRTTFAETPTPITGMPELYAHIHALLSPSWTYLSASPYNLYPFLHSFLHAHYPAGPIILRPASWMDLAGLLASLTQGTQSYKFSRIEQIHGWLPRRKLLCLGDSTQTDPEAYAQAYRKFPGWIRAIFIRKVTGIAEMDLDGQKNEAARFEKAFKGVPREVWRVFEQPEELYDMVAELAAEK
ncbi:MAG: hypothetical protein M1819_000551 [Sarea resinae]|nr:MAG: hypothetical protein M1819_000551 [Sarea resinae]